MGLLDMLSSLAPALGTALSATPGGLLVGLAETAVGKVFGCSTDQVHDTLAAAVNNPDPAVQAQILDAERQLKADAMAHAEALRSLDLQVYQTQTADLANVRQMIVATQDRTSERLAYMTFAGFMCVVAALFFKGIPVDQVTLVLVTTVVNQSFNLAHQALSVFTGASPPTNPKN